jgi:TPR repeat protein
MLRIASVSVAITLEAWAPSDYASTSQIGAPALPPSPRPTIAYRQWNDLIPKVSDGGAATATDIGKMFAYGSNAPRDVPEAIRWLSRRVDLESKRRVP